MSALADKVQIARRFQKSIRIDSDIGTAEALDGYILPNSAADVLANMAGHVAETGQGAFTWTGPYGSGKSSLIVIVSALLSDDPKLRKKAESLATPALVKSFRKGFPATRKGWTIVPAVGWRAPVATILGEALKQASVVSRAPKVWTEKKILKVLSYLIDDTATDGAVLFIDEMGKILESAANESSDIYLFQQLAELASRSNGKLIIVGALHQSFDEYANRMAREVRDEWSKIQGRFVDLVVNVAGEEQIDLLSRAIMATGRPASHDKLSSEVAGELAGSGRGQKAALTNVLSHTWPLHPAVAALLGPISRRRFGQNQRSLFGFLNSAEPSGFQDFLRHAGKDDLYRPALLWDYLQRNLEPSILASPDGHRWAIAAEAVSRCEMLGGDPLHIEILKTIAVLDLFRAQSGLSASERLLWLSLPKITQAILKQHLQQLTDWSLIIHKRHLGGYAVFAGSDFDFDAALDEALVEIGKMDFSQISELADLQPILAKRHYHETGALRWFDFDVCPLSAALERAENFETPADSIGLFLLAVPTDGETEAEAEAIARKIGRLESDTELVIGISPRSWAIGALAKEVSALALVRDERAELVGDPVARREVNSRLSDLSAKLEAELELTADTAAWYYKQREPRQFIRAELSGFASDIAEKLFPDAPHIHNELLNRVKPSSSAIAAQNALLKHMVEGAGKHRLGIQDYPAEGGLFASLLEATGLYREARAALRFTGPTAKDPANLASLWKAADKLLKENAHRSVSLSEVYALWRAAPYGVKDGLMPVLSVAYILSQSDKVALYRQQIFQAQFSDLDVDYLAKDPSDIQLRWMDLNDISRSLLSELAGIVREIDETNELANLEPIDVGRGLIAIYADLPTWTQRTLRLSANATKIRSIFKKANDPNQLIFNDLPRLVGDDEADAIDQKALKKVAEKVRDGLAELVAAYPTMLARITDNLLLELDVPNSSSQALLELRDRAENIRELSGDFRLNAFIGRLSQFEGSRDDIEGLASLATNKPPRHWIDADLDNAGLELADFAQQFLRAETFARVKGRSDKRHAVAMVLGLDGRPTSHAHEFTVDEADRKVAKAIAQKLRNALADHAQADREVLLAALAELSAEIMAKEGREDRPVPPQEAVV
ncbi:hypothetical protein [Qipengyuania sp. 483]